MADHMIKKERGLRLDFSVSPLAAQPPRGGSASTSCEQTERYSDFDNGNAPVVPITQGISCQCGWDRTGSAALFVLARVEKFDFEIEWV
eukprot:2354667-Pyramimonas_sp.AAC.1